ncbi:MAG: signal peptidase II [Marmoricola sp.]
MQAARGASLSPSDPADTDHRPARSSRRLVLAFAAVAVVAWVLDQVSKHLAVAKLTNHSPVHVVGDLLQLTLTRNPGAAFSTGTGFTQVFSVVAVIATLVIVWFGLRAGTTLWAIALGLLLAGVTGNLTDRLFRSPGPLRGHVVDFLMLPHWPVFNVADVCINIAAVVIVIQALRGVRIDGARTPQRVRDSDPQGRG